MLNISFTGKIFKENGNQVSLDECSYRGLFKKINTSSSNDKIDIIRQSELGMYNLNLGDASWLGQDGVASPGDIVILLFWLPNSENNYSPSLTEWCAIEYTLTNDSVYVQDVQLKSHQNPTCLFHVNGDHVNETIQLTNMGSHDNYSYTFYNKEHYQKYQQHNFILFEMNHLPNDTLDISWGDGQYDNNLSITSNHWEHIYTLAGDYTITATIENRTDRLSCTFSYNIHVIYKVINGLLWNEPVYVNQSTTYNPNIGGDVTQISGVDYYIDGVLTYMDLDYDESFNHTFITTGDHTIRQCIKYNDGFVNKEQCQNFLIKLSSMVSFTDEDYECGKKFKDTSIVGKPPITNYEWYVMDGVIILANVSGSNYNEFYYAWPYPGTFHVRLNVTDSNDEEKSLTKVYDVYDCPSGTNTGSGGMGGSVITHTIYKDRPLPVIKIINTDDNTEKKNKEVKILSVKEILI
jgi:hypothetical protein